jgi:hypothetical protein
MLPLNSALSVFADNLPEIRKALIENVEEIVKTYSPHKELDVDGEWAIEDIYGHVNWLKIQEDVVPMLQTVRRIDSYRHFTNPKNKSIGGVTDLDIENARHVEADWFIQEAQLSTRRPFRGQCPFHPDHDPSLTLMKSKQKGTLYLKCFACGTHVDSIGYIMKRDNVGFIDAVKYIVS